MTCVRTRTLTISTFVREKHNVYIYKYIYIYVHTRCAHRNQMYLKHTQQSNKQLIINIQEASNSHINDIFIYLKGLRPGTATVPWGCRHCGALYAIYMSASDEKCFPVFVFPLVRRFVCSARLLSAQRRERKWWNAGNFSA